MNTLGGRAASVLIGLATAIVIIALAILPFLTPAVGRLRAGPLAGAAWTGFTTEELRTATDAILADLVFGGDFAVEVNGTARPQRARTRPTWPTSGRSSAVCGSSPSSRSWSCSSRAGGATGPRRGGPFAAGAIGLTVGVVILGVDRALRLRPALRGVPRDLLPGRLVPVRSTHGPARPALPVPFWHETAIVVGVVIIAISLGRGGSWPGRRAGARTRPLTPPRSSRSCRNPAREPPPRRGAAQRRGRS